MKVYLKQEEWIEEFMIQNAQSRASLKKWLDWIDTADWQQPGDIKNSKFKADLLGKGSCRVIFNIAGNNYRMICRYYFYENFVMLFICWIGTHAEYDKICAGNNQYTV